MTEDAEALNRDAKAVMGKSGARFRFTHRS